jgi:hypothetical protein
MVCFTLNHTQENTMTNSPRTAGEQVYDEMVNHRPEGYWGDPHEEGLAVMKDVKQRLLDIGCAQIFSGHPERGWTFTTVGEKVDSLNRRIRRWEQALGNRTHAA